MPENVTNNSQNYAIALGSSLTMYRYHYGLWQNDIIIHQFLILCMHY